MKTLSLVLITICITSMACAEVKKSRIGFVPTAVASSNLGAGGTCTLSAESTDLLGSVSIHIGVDTGGNGLSLGLAGAQCTLTFPARRYAPTCMLTPASADASIVLGQDTSGNVIYVTNTDYVTTTTTTIVLNKSHPIAAQALDEVWNYSCIEP